MTPGPPRTPPPLTPGEFEELERLFHQTVALSAPDRAAFLADLRVRSAALAGRLAAMLEHDAGGSAIVELAVADGARAVVGAEHALIGARFGAYRAERVIGRGGMGAVFLGSRADDAFRQTVAIKTIRAGLESRESLERFRREREILARLNHPGIARLLDGGTGPAGVPFVVMEFVEGEPLIAHVTKRRMGVRHRVALFLELCDAVEFVHRNLVVHRDIKPANVLVTAAGRVKLLDFGIAKLTDEFDAGAPLTATAARAMTPEYASPEQIQGRPVTTATDVYALGVLLYELLTGERPIRFDSSNPYELAREIVSRIPSAPSEAVRRGAPGRAGLPGPPKKIARQLDGDLDRIVMMAMRKEPERRYASVAALAADLGAWLSGRPVAAQRDTWRYRLRKFVGRHPVPSLAGVLFVAVVAAFTLITMYQSRAIAEERDNAVIAERRASANAAFLVKLFTTADPREAGNRNMTAFDLLQAGVAQLERDEDLDPRVRGDLYLTLGLALANLEQFEPGIAALRRSVEESERAYGRDSLETAERLNLLGDVLRPANQIDEAYSLVGEALAIRRRHMSGDSYEIADSYNNLAIVTILLGRYREADELQAASVAMHRRLTGDRSPEIAVPVTNLAWLRTLQGRLYESLALARQGHEILATTDDQSSTVWALTIVADIRREMGQVREAERLYEEALERNRSLLGPTHSRVLERERDLAFSRYLLGDYDEAGRRYEELESRTRRLLGGQSEAAAQVGRLRGLLDRDLGHLESADRRLRAALADLLAATGPRHFRVPSFRRSLAEALIDRGQLPEAEAQLRETLAVLPEAAAFPHVERARALIVLARTLRLRSRPADAQAALQEARAIIGDTTGEGSLDMGLLLLEEGLLAELSGDGSRSGPLLERSAAILSAGLPPRHPDRVEVMSRLRP